MITTDDDYKIALERIDALMNCSTEPYITELSVLVDLVIAYETKHFPIDPPTQEEAAQFRMEQDG